MLIFYFYRYTQYVHLQLFLYEFFKVPCPEREWGKGEASLKVCTLLHIGGGREGERFPLIRIWLHVQYLYYLLLKVCPRYSYNTLSRHLPVALFVFVFGPIQVVYCCSVHLDESVISGDSTSLLVGREPSLPRGRQSRPSLVKALGKTFWRVFLISAVLKLVQDLLSFVSPQLLRCVQ